MNRRARTRKTRPYRSDVRVEQAALTRRRILDAALAVVRRDPDELAMKDVAREAGVAVPTVYRHFATLDDLIREVEADFNARLFAGIDPSRMNDLSARRAELHRFFANVEAFGPEWNTIAHTKFAIARRKGRLPMRREFVASAYARELAALDEPARTHMADAIAVLFSTGMARLLMEYLDVDAARAADCVLWIADVLSAHALRASEGRKR